MVVPPALRVVFFGTPQFAVPTLERLLQSRHDVVGVVTQPDRPRGRGQRVSDAPVKERAAAAGVNVLQPDRLRDPVFLNAIAGWHPDVGVVAAYGRILPDPLLALPRLGLINVHASLLPKYRGAAPVHRAILAGERETGVTIMRIVKALDAGPMMATTTRTIGQEETSVDIEHALSTAGAALLLDVLDQLAAGTAVEIPQDEARATYAPRLTRDDGLIDWRRPARAIHDQVRGLYPWPHAHTTLRGRRLIVRRTAPPGGGPAAGDGGPPEAGTIVAAAGDELRVQAGDGPIRVLEIQAEGKRPMAAREFLAGHAGLLGSTFDPS